MKKSAVDFITPSPGMLLFNDKWSRKKMGDIIDPNKSMAIWSNRVSALRDYSNNLTVITPNFPKIVNSLPLEFPKGEPLNFREVFHVYVLSLWSKFNYEVNGGVTPQYVTFFNALANDEWDNIRSLLEASIEQSSSGEYRTLEDLFLYLLKRGISSDSTEKITQVTVNV